VFNEIFGRTSLKEIIVSYLLSRKRKIMNIEVDCWLKKSNSHCIVLFVGAQWDTV
jgi:hypothetical protein